MTNDEGEVILVIKMKKLTETKFQFNIMKSSLTPVQEKAMKVFIENMVLKEQYSNFVPIEDIGRLIR